MTACNSCDWERLARFGGAGRPVKVETGDSGGTKSIMETEYVACACSALGKVWRVSLPYAPGGAKVWTTYGYDGLGRQTSVTAADGSVTTTVYAGNAVTVYEGPAGSAVWKRYVRNAMGNLTAVYEPNPAGGAELATTYTYDAVNHLTGVTMTRQTMSVPPTNVTQTRTFGYDGNQRLQQVTTPESGTVTYTYNADGTLATKVDAKGQKTAYGYDGYGRVDWIQHHPNQYGAADPCQSVAIDYDYPVATLMSETVAYRKGRMAAVGWGSAADSTCTGPGFVEQYAYTQAGQVQDKRLSVAMGGASGYLEAYFAYNGDGNLVLRQGPWSTEADFYALQDTVQYTYDGMGRPVQMDYRYRSGYATVAQVNNVTYGAAGQMLGLQYAANGYTETRTYDTMYRLTGISGSGGGMPGIGLTYRYPANNGGRIDQATEATGGGTNTVGYQYDALQRLVAANSTGPDTWGLSFGYDGFGNRRSQVVTAGTGPQVELTIDSSKNQVVGNTYDGNGNVTGTPDGKTYGYDVENRMVSGGGESYLYHPLTGQRVCKAGCAELYYYGSGGEKVATYGVTSNGNALVFQNKVDHWWFGGRVVKADGKWVVTDRLGSVRGNSSGERFAYYPYGEERVGTAEGRTKFGTYHRDGTGLDYAGQRYYSPATGRFMTADPAVGGSLDDPQSLNLYAYAGNDPINFNDPDGLQKCGDIPIAGGAFDGMTVSQVMHGTSGTELMAQLIYHEGGTIYQSDLSNIPAYILDLVGIGTAILNQWDVDNGRLTVYDGTGNSVHPIDGRMRFRSLKQIILAIARDDRGAIFDSSGHMRQPEAGNINSALNTDVSSGPLIQDVSGTWINRGCEGILASITVANGLYLGGMNDRYKPNGLILLYWNQASPDSTTTFPGSAGFIGVQKVRQRGETFWGLPGEVSTPARRIRPPRPIPRPGPVPM